MHTLHCIDKGYKDVVVYAGNTDVLVLLVSFCQRAEEFHKSNTFAYFVVQGGLKNVYDIKFLYSNIGLEFCDALPFF